MTLQKRGGRVGAVSRNTEHPEATLGLSVTVEDGEAGTTIYVGGELDAYTAPQLWQSLETAIGQLGPVVVDLGGLHFIDSTGLSVLVRAQRALRDGQLVVRSAPPIAVKVFEITGVHKLIRIEP